MKIISPSYEILSQITGKELEDIVQLGRAFLKVNSDKIKISKSSAREFVKSLIKNQKESPFNFFYLSVRFTCDQIFADKIVELRNMNNFSDVSVRKIIEKEDLEGLEFVWPCFFGEYNEENATQEASMHWQIAMLECERRYLSLLKNGCDTQQASTVLPNSIKTEVIATGTYQDWRRFFYRYVARYDSFPGPQMEELAIPLLRELIRLIPEVFDDVYVKWLELADTRKIIEGERLSGFRR